VLELLWGMIDGGTTMLEMLYYEMFLCKLRLCSLYCLYNFESDCSNWVHPAYHPYC